MMSNSKEVESNNVQTEVWKVIGDRVNEWLTKTFNEIKSSK